MAMFFRVLTHACIALMWATPWLATPAVAEPMANTVSDTVSDNTTAVLSTETVVVRGRSEAPAAAITGFGDADLARTPVQAEVFNRKQLDDGGVAILSDLTRLDAAVDAAYNAPGYWSGFSVRGYIIDNRFNFRRDGLPISAETLVMLDNKDAIEVLKGTSGMQAGTSAPGGIVNLIVARPALNQRSATLRWLQGSTLAATDISQRFGADERFGVRVNAAYEHLDPAIRQTQGKRHLLAVAADWRVSADTLLEAEIETSHQSQPSVPAFSLLGAAVPDAGRIDPRTNLNNQPWSLPVIFDGSTASLRWQQRLNDDWRFTAHAGTQRLRTDDHLAFPFGCSAEGNYDRYCSDGSFDLYDFRSDNEHRNTDAVDLSLQGRITTGAWRHAITFEAVYSRFEARLQPRVDDAVIVGSGSIDGLTVIPTLPDLGFVPNTNRTERSTELSLRDHVELSPEVGLWAGARHTRLARDSVRTDGTGPTHYTQSFTTPWLALSYAFAPDQLVYASWGQGIESSITPNKSGYINPGQPLPAQKSRQIEVGLKGTAHDTEWSLAAFDIDRPTVTDNGVNFFIDGSARHRGLDASATWRSGAWTLRGSALLLHARREGAGEAASNGLVPANVPERTLKLQLGHDVTTLPGLTLLAAMQTESSRYVLPDNSIQIPGWANFDLAARYTIRTSDTTTTTLRAAIDNLFDRRAWRESPYQYGHAYLYPLAPRTVSLSAQVTF